MALVSQPEDFCKIFCMPVNNIASFIHHTTSEKQQSLYEIFIALFLRIIS